MKVRTFIHLLRASNWYKNLLIFLPSLLVNGLVGTLLNLKIGILFIIISILSSSLYIINDILDIEEDRRDPEKNKRPIALGEVGIETASLLSYILMGVSFLVVLLIYNSIISELVVCYLISNVVYLLVLREYFPYDIITIGINSVIRILLGYSIIFSLPNVLILSLVFIGTLMTGLSKRIHELSCKKEVRRSLKGISLLKLEKLSIILMWIFISNIVILGLVGAWSIFTSFILILLIIKFEIDIITNPSKYGTFRNYLKDWILLVLLGIVFISLVI